MGSEPTTRAEPPGPGRYRFGGIVLDAAAHTLTRDGQPQALEPKAFAVLLELVGHAGELVGRDQLLDAVWGHRHVTPGVLTRAIAQLRTALDDDPHHPRYIQTQHALGYRFIGTLEPEEPAAAAPMPACEPSDPATAGDPPPQADRRTAAYPEIERRRGLRRQPWHWLAFAGLLFAALAWNAWQRKADEAHRPVEASIAVLPFTTLSDDQQDRYFAEGLAAEMLNALAGVHGIRVAAWIPPEAVDRKLDIKALGAKLGVATVLDASVRRDGQRLRISARLSDTTSGYTLWSQNYEHETSAIFDTQTEIANEVATALVGVLPDAGASLRKRLTPTRNVAAFDAYLRGVQALMQPGEHGSAALGHFQEALAKDAGFARAQAGICRIEAWRFEAHHNADAYENARMACLRAANMDPGIGIVQLALGDLYRANGPPAKALEHYRLAEADPAVRTDAIAGQASVFAAEGDMEKAIETFHRALAIDPDDAGVHAALGYQQHLAGNPREAITSYRRATTLIRRTPTCGAPMAPC
ncbi:winged helix-turn-helix domain-containing protein [Arenimonas daejeonensis]|uniref:winged helix-turn-helix domain-containing protein n=1 Tax=Arenimonas daejeonensis TaxID=370777 RepID=UPI0011BF8C13|nr:winged helix-turn-helix domain-containing protein [Arenimonas daejeonensis]